ncbi:hypothetical protein CFP56_012596 [Quercus suber]|uniref:Uncharacterized protein n=1 Tax=Quercus suber TaxID=58331 RepID=A0AAW0KVG2_QUESU
MVATLGGKSEFAEVNIDNVKTLSSLHIAGISNRQRNALHWKHPYIPRSLAKCKELPNAASNKLDHNGIVNAALMEPVVLCYLLNANT